MARRGWRSHWSWKVPSLNLLGVLTGIGTEELVERAAVAPSAPTAESVPSRAHASLMSRLRAGRINFKLGEVKKAFAFTDADFALWLESENQWGIRLKARPTRTDVGELHNTGILKLDGRFQRASRFPNTPLIQITYSGGPLGQLTKLIYGRDRGWRGNVRSNASLTGTPSALEVTLDAQVDDFRRYDIALGEALPLLAHFARNLFVADDSLHALQCESPVGSGVLEVRGNAQGWAADAYDLSGRRGQRFPQSRNCRPARHSTEEAACASRQPATLKACSAVRKLPGDSPVWAGGGRTNLLALHSSVLKQDLQIGTIDVVVPKATVPPDCNLTFRIT